MGQVGTYPTVSSDVARRGAASRLAACTFKLSSATHSLSTHSHFLLPKSYDTTAVMSSRRQGGNRIRGPNSALTDFLAANNISAQQIRDDYEQRRAQAAQQQATDATQPQEESASTSGSTPSGRNAPEVEAGPSDSKKRKATSTLAEKKALAKIKKSKEFQRRKSIGKGFDSDSDSEYDDFLARDIYKKKQPPPGQLENCEICNKRFTVTAYSKTGPDGGLLCTPCGKELAADAGPSKKAKKATATKRRRKIESDRMDASYKPQGAKTLQQLCIEKVAAHANDVDEFGDLPEQVLDRLGEIFSKKRVLDPRTLKLFLRSDLDGLAVHDSAYLETDDYTQIFMEVPHVQKVVLRNAGQYKDENMKYMLEKAKNIRSLQLYASNLVSNDMWKQLFLQRADKLEELKLQWLDASFDDDCVETMAQHCPNLRRLKLKRCRQITVAAINSISRLQNLHHLSLQTNAEVESDRVVNLIGCVGANLETLSLETMIDSNDDVLSAIHDQCRNLRKLRFTDNDLCTDAGFVALFTEWANPPLRFIDVNSTRDVDNQHPDGPAEPNGLASEGFKVLMKHSGPKLETLNIASCRHISHAAFCDVFDGQKQYPHLSKIDISFCNAVDTTVVAGIFKSCPKLERLVSFGNFGVEDVVVPRDVVLIGVPKAQDTIEQIGEAWMGLDQAMEQMAGVVGVGA
ncbi:uncharacterized protein K452DRAFT_298759 [Aplosporella prunicola CBS 121167]|uniref:DNA repair protein rhp7 treble clef domain-containing protein n=1 Tax=Aplosporella prunicola CBS 121167 TaxID=1176127 RepID=A0A6A6BAY3_9PEZI|nr:uncharacterized protein K452DRAFT_298759 [Aplosporella prunicola CBS 121167]KAF2141379.1 hypothetical protein K452DRAFT_298759 [Aplosporella prunicola CBS 121167]